MALNLNFGQIGSGITSALNSIGGFLSQPSSYNLSQTTPKTLNLSQTGPGPGLLQQATNYLAPQPAVVAPKTTSTGYSTGGTGSSGYSYTPSVPSYSTNTPQLPTYQGPTAYTPQQIASMTGQSSYPGLLSQLAQTSSQPSLDYKTAYDQLLAKSQAPSAEYNAALQNANQYNSALEQSRINEAKGLAANAGNPIPLEFQQGRGQILQSQYAQEQNALGQAYNAATAQQGSANSQQQIQQAGLTSAGGLANTAQELQQSGLNSAASLAQPVTQFGVLTNPQTGNPVNGQSATNAAIQGGTIQGLQSGAQTAAATGGNIQSQQTTQIAQYTSALQQGKNLQAQFTDLLNTFNLNPSDINAANAAIQKIAQNTSRPQYQILSNYINDIANTYSQILTPAGGSQTDTTRAIATSMLNSTASGQSLQTVMNALDQQAQAKIAGVSTTNTNQNGTTTQPSGWY